MKRFLVKAFLRLFSLLPLSVHHFNAHILGWLTRCVARYRVKVVKENIDNAFPEKSEKERKRIFKDFYLHFAQIITEAIWFGGSDPGWAFSNIGQEEIEGLLHYYGPGLGYTSFGLNCITGKGGAYLEWD